MAKGSVRKKGKKWYFRFYVEDESGNKIQKEMAGTESKSETEKMLRKAMDEYENKVYTKIATNTTLGELLDLWIKDELNPSSRSNGTIKLYTNVSKSIKKSPIGKRKLKSINVEHLQSYFDSLAMGSIDKKPLSHATRHVYITVLKGAFTFAVFPKKLITFNPMQYITNRNANSNYQLFTETRTEQAVASKTISDTQYSEFIEKLKMKNSFALVPIQIAYYDFP